MQWWFTAMYKRVNELSLKCNEVGTESCISHLLKISYIALHLPVEARHRFERTIAQQKKRKQIWFKQKTLHFGRKNHQRNLVGRISNVRYIHMARLVSHGLVSNLRRNSLDSRRVELLIIIFSILEFLAINGDDVVARFNERAAEIKISLKTLKWKIIDPHYSH